MCVSRQLLVFEILLLAVASSASAESARPNIFVAISDDQSWPHASAYGSKMVETPNFDQVASRGILFRQAFCASPGCSPSRAALLTGLNTWQLEHAGTHASYFAPKFTSFPDQLESAGYFVGFTGKGWGPGDFRTLGRTRNPAGMEYGGQRKPRAWQGNQPGFEEFLNARPEGMPFCFWFGSSDPHRRYDRDSGVGSGKNLKDAEVPSFLPDCPTVRGDLLDYCAEIERFDRDLGAMLQLLENRQELQNTLVIVTSDNGMPFPRSKANCYEYGIHMPLAMRWDDGIKPGRVVDDLIGFTDLTATIYEVTRVAPPDGTPGAGKEMTAILESEASGMVDPSRTAVFAARERHSSSRYNSLSYPQRCIRTREYLYIRNFAPERWPAGTPEKYTSAEYADDGSLIAGKLGPIGGAFHDIDASPTLTYLVQSSNDPRASQCLAWATDKRPAEELYAIENDPGCLKNLAGAGAYAEVRDAMSVRLMRYLAETGDARAGDAGDVWETYPRVSSLRWFPEPSWTRRQRPPTQPWLETRRPRDLKR